MTFQLDASGSVEAVVSLNGGPIYLQTVRWPDLSPFTQGYIEALFASFGRGQPGHMLTGLGFSDLAPETLARIIADCEALRTRFGGNAYCNAEHGRRFWEERQRGAWGPFPPLTPYLGDKGRVYLREAG